MSRDGEGRNQSRAWLLWRNPPIDGLGVRNKVVPCLPKEYICSFIG